MTIKPRVLIRRNTKKFSTRNNSVGIATGYGLDYCGSFPSRDKRLLFSPQLVDRLGTHISSYPMSISGLFPEGLSNRGMKLTTHYHLVPRSRKV
jgi:hypothetical protein